jgi:hypothetical protein
VDASVDPARAVVIELDCRNVSPAVIMAAPHRTISDSEYDQML